MHACERLHGAPFARLPPYLCSVLVPGGRVRAIEVVHACKWLWLNTIRIAESLTVHGGTRGDTCHQAAVHACKQLCVMPVSCTLSSIIIPMFERLS